MQHIARTHTRRACAGGCGSLRGQGQCRIARPELCGGLLLVTRRQARLDLNPDAKPKPTPDPTPTPNQASATRTHSSCCASSTLTWRRCASTRPM
eukprot:scaffold90772_cov60-Phaeocystis_antarctica.AAC.2